LISDKAEELLKLFLQVIFCF